MTSIIIIFIAVYVWRDVKDDYKPFFAALFGLAAIVSELSTDLTLIRMLSDRIGGLIL